jgi:hypothetical protein
MRLLIYCFISASVVRKETATLSLENSCKIVVALMNHMDGPNQSSFKVLPSLFVCSSKFASCCVLYGIERSFQADWKDTSLLTMVKFLLSISLVVCRTGSWQGSFALASAIVLQRMQLDGLIHILLQVSSMEENRPVILSATKKESM